ncbi:MAG: MotA/TolQ/ExbB proton channel family protein [Planctomycetes bacterium]|nr:MotA/TolQ/ExbB proton channel family protein [Planctomycetota bacterium]
MKVSKVWANGLVAATFLAAVSVSTYAQDAAAPGAEVDNGDLTFQKYLDYGGWVGWLIIVCSVAMVALIIEHCVNIQRDKLVPPEVIDELEALLTEQEYQEALELCESEKNFVTAMVGAALTHMEHGFDEMRDAATGAATSEIGKLNQKISYMTLLANIAPMLGLFGTVFGMVGAFTEIVKLGPAVTPKDLAGGVQQALITTVDGLLVAIPCICFGFYIKNKVNTICDELQSVGFDMIERFRVAGKSA